MTKQQTPINYHAVDSIRFCAELDKPVIYFPNYGNLGDALIPAGTKMAFDALGLTLQSSELINKIPNAGLIYAGGGNLVPYYSDCSKFLSAVLSKPHTVVLLPHTISGHTNLIKNLDQRHHIFCREAPSYRYVSELQSAKTYFDHDLALRINPEILFSNYSNNVKIAPDKIIRAIEFILRKSTQHSKSNGRNGYLFREDKESIVNKITDSFDISGIINSKWPASEFSTLLSAAFLMALSMFDRIYTDRLHVAIGASLLNIPTTLYSNSYYKNKAVFESSLNKPNSYVKFEDQPSFL